MNTPQGTNRQLPGRMTIAEICQAYPDQHVVIGELDYDEQHMTVRSGVVIGHSRIRKEALAMSHPYRLEGGHIALRFTGVIKAPVLPLWYR